MTRSKTYTPELRKEVVKLVLTQGLTLEDASLRLTIPKGTLRVAEQRGMDERERLRMDKLRQLDEAIRARTTVQATTPRNTRSAPAGGAPLSREEAHT